MIVRHLLVATALCSSFIWAQNASPQQAPPKNQPHPPASNPGNAMPPDTVAPGKTPPAQQSSQKSGAAANTASNRADAYYHYSLGHFYEEMVTSYGRADYLSSAVEEYKKAIAADPESQFLSAALVELYAHTGRIRDAVTEANEVVRRDPGNLEAHKLLADIYWRLLAGGGQSQEMLRLALQEFEAVVRLEPNVAANHLMLGRLYEVGNQLGKAEAEFKAAAKIDPGFEDPRGATLELATLYTDEGQPQRAITLLNTIPESSRSPRTYMAFGSAYQQLGDSRHAVESFRKAVQADGDNLDAHRGLATALLSSGQTDAALQEYRTIVAGDPQDAQSYTRMADILRRNGRFDEALESLTKAEAISQDSLEIAYIRSEIYEAQGRYDEAANLLQSLVQRTTRAPGNDSPSDQNNRAIFLERLGNVYKSANKSELAVETFRKMIDLGGDNAARGYEDLIEHLRDQKQYQEAMRASEQAVQKFPNNVHLKLLYTNQLADLGQGDEAIAQARAMLKNKPEDREVWQQLAQINQRLKRWKDAEDAANKAAELAARPEDREFADYLLASTYERAKRYDQAEQIFRKLVTEYPQNPIYLNYLGYMLADRGVHLEEAISYIKKAVSMEPQNGAYLDSLGWAYFKMGNYQLAEENLRRAIDHMPNDPTIQDHMGDLYQKTGRLKLAANHWERALFEWNKSVPADVDPGDVSKTQKKLETVKVKLAQQNGVPKQQ
jgi:tetratricopeptide (TPR) repeat protein